MKNVEKKLARLQAQFDTANTATKRLQEKYYKATCDIYLAPNVAYAAEHVTNSNQFITRRERSYYWLKESLCLTPLTAKTTRFICYSNTKLACLHSHFEF